MARPHFVTAHSADARGAEAAMTDPRAVISRRLYVPRPDHPPLALPLWELPLDPKAHPDAKDYELLLRIRRLFVVGGLNFVIRLGLLPVWYNDPERRAEAAALIEKRGWRPILDAFEFKDSNGLFGQDLINRFFRTIPRLDRESDQDEPYEQARLIWSDHLLRLRKAIEFIVLTEAVLAWRFRIGETLDRYQRYTGRDFPSPSTATEVPDVWDFLWISPALHQVVHPPRYVDLPQLLKQDAIVDAFRTASGQGVHDDPVVADRVAKGVLYWALRGAPGRWRTIEAAAHAGTTFSAGNGGAASLLATKNVHDFIDRGRKRKRGETASAYDGVFEDVRELGDRNGAGGSGAWRTP